MLHTEPSDKHSPLAEQLPTLYRQCSPDAQSELTVQVLAASDPVPMTASLKALASSAPSVGPASPVTAGEGDRPVAAPRYTALFVCVLPRTVRLTTMSSKPGPHLTDRDSDGTAQLHSGPVRRLAEHFVDEVGQAWSLVPPTKTRIES
jgi:hypothetical protein